MPGLIDLQPPTTEPATVPLTVWQLRKWDRHTDRVTPYASYEAALADLAAGARSSWDNVRSNDGVPNTPAELGDAEAVAIYYGQVPDGQPLTSGDRCDEGFNLYADTVTGVPAEEVWLRTAAFRVQDKNPDEPLSQLPTYVMEAHGIRVSATAGPDGPTVHLVNETWPAGTQIRVLRGSTT
jgi:hypothetical protein